MLYDAQGNELPGAKTAEEVQADITAATEAIKQAAETEKSALQTQLEETKAALEANAARLAAASNKDQNFNALRDENKKLTDTIKSLDDKIANVTKSVGEQLASKTKDDVIAKLSGNDADLAAKIRVNYERLMKLETAVTDEIITKVAAEAYKLSVDVPQPNVLRSIGSSKPQGGPANVENDNLDPAVVEAGRAFGLSAEDIKKFGGKK
jgi:hypothetical protein